MTNEGVRLPIESGPRDRDSSHAPAWWSPHPTSSVGRNHSHTCHHWKSWSLSTRPAGLPRPAVPAKPASTDLSPWPTPSDCAPWTDSGRCWPPACSPRRCWESSRWRSPWRSPVGRSCSARRTRQRPRSARHSGRRLPARRAGAEPRHGSAIANSSAHVGVWRDRGSTGGGENSRFGGPIGAHVWGMRARRRRETGWWRLVYRSPRRCCCSIWIM